MFVRVLDYAKSKGCDLLFAFRHRTLFQAGVTQSNFDIGNTRGTAAQLDLTGKHSAGNATDAIHLASSSLTMFRQRTGRPHSFMRFIDSHGTDSIMTTQEDSKARYRL